MLEDMMQSEEKTSAFRLRVCLPAILPPHEVWRVVTVPKWFTLGFLHPLLQTVRVQIGPFSLICGLFFRLCS